jgi:hypothetical protein
MPRPCRVAKGLDCVFSIWFTQYSRVWFKHAMPRPSRAQAATKPSPFAPVLGHGHTVLKVTSQGHVTTRHGRSMGMKCVNQHWPSRDYMWATCPLPASSGYHADFYEVCYRKHTNPLNCRTSSSDISGYHADFHEDHCTVWEWQELGIAGVNWRGTAWQRKGMGAAWHVWISL